MGEKKIKVLLADDTLIAREGWKRILETADDVEIVGEATTAQETPRKVIMLKPDVLLMDLRWFGDDTAGQVAIKEIKKLSPKVKIIAITAYENLIRDARTAGADAALTKTFSREDLLGLIRELASRQESFETPKPINTPLEELTQRELQVLAFLVKGKRDKEIAEELHIATTTVKNHVKSILDKLDAQNRTEASNKARELGLLR